LWPRRLSSAHQHQSFDREQRSDSISITHCDRCGQQGLEPGLSPARWRRKAKASPRLQLGVEVVVVPVVEEVEVVAVVVQVGQRRPARAPQLVSVSSLHRFATKSKLARAQPARSPKPFPFGECGSRSVSQLASCASCAACQRRMAQRGPVGRPRGGPAGRRLPGQRPGSLGSCKPKWLRDT
jgi:hypothetical protein